MNCWHCKTQLLWGGDEDCIFEEDFDMVTNLSCPTCKSFVLVFYKEKEDEPTNGDVHAEQ